MFPETLAIEGLSLRQLADGHLDSDTRAPKRVAFNAVTPIGGIMPAEHGTSMLKLVDGEIRATAIIAWQVSAAGAVPITEYGPHDGGEPDAYAVEYSHRGEVFAPGNRLWKNRADWLASLKQEHLPVAPYELAAAEERDSPIAR